MKTISGFTATAACLIALCGSAAAEQLRYATGFSTGTPIVTAAEQWADKVKAATDGELTISVFALSLLNHAETSAGLRDGLADVGNLTVAYDPGRYPIMEYLSDLTFALAPRQAQNDSLAYVGAISEYILLQCDDCRSEFAAQNQIYLGGTASAPHDLLCARDPIRTRADFASRSVRVGTEAYSRFVTEFGAAATRISINEIIEAFNQGVVECAVLHTGEIKNYRMEEVIKAVTLGVPGGSYSGMTSGNFNMDTWRGLSERDRAVLVDLAADLSGEMTWGYLASRQVGIDEALERNVPLVEPDPELAAEVLAYRERQLDFVVDFYRNQHNLAKAQEIADEFKALLDKWTPLVVDVKDGAELSELYRAEIFSNIDAATYGMPGS